MRRKSQIGALGKQETWYLHCVNNQQSAETEMTQFFHWLDLYPVVKVLIGRRKTLHPYFGTRHALRPLSSFRDSRLKRQTRCFDCFLKCTGLRIQWILKFPRSLSCLCIRLRFMLPVSSALLGSPYKNAGGSLML